MKLILTNGYPYPYPKDATDDRQLELCEQAPGNTLQIPGVVNFEWKHTVTVQFADSERCELAREFTGWESWSESPPTLEARTSAGDGYDHPAIIAGDMAYCGFMLLND
jgi:hypothetical protein